MIYDTRPEPGDLAADLGHGVTVVARKPTRVQGAVWVAPWAVNCTAHGWVVSTRTVDQASEAARSHIGEDHQP
jgi:hypothetical protein